MRTKPLVYDNAQVYGNAKIYDAQVYDKAQVYDDAKVYYDAKVYNETRVYGNAYITDKAEVFGNAIVRGNAQICGDTKVCDEIIGEDNNNNEQLTALAQDFIYKIDDSDKLNVKTEYSSIDEYFSSDYQNDTKLDTLIICTADTKIPIIKFEKIEKDKQLKFKFIVDLTTKNEDHFLIQSFIETKEQLSQKLTQTVDALNHYPEFSKYIDDLSNCLYG